MELPGPSGLRPASPVGWEPGAGGPGGWGLGVWAALSFPWAPGVGARAPSGDSLQNRIAGVRREAGVGGAGGERRGRRGRQGRTLPLRGRGEQVVPALSSLAHCARQQGGQ